MALCLYAFVPTSYATELSVQDVWARPTLSSFNKNGVIYLRVHSPKEDKLLAVSTPIAYKAEVHEMYEQGEALRMRHVKVLPIKMGNTVLKPGGYHVMLLGIKEKLKVGRKFPLELTFETAGKKEVEVLVKPLH